MSSAPSSDPALALRWLRLHHRVMLGASALSLSLAPLDPELRLPYVALLTVLAAWGILGLLVTRLPAPPRWSMRLHLGLDLLGLTAFLLLAGGTQNPIQAFYLVLVALMSVTLPRPERWPAVLAILVAQAASVSLARHVPGLDASEHEHWSPHLLGHVLAFDLAAVVITALVGRLVEALAAREAALREAEAASARSARLASVGTLAGGVAHALGTPLGAIALLAEEAALDLPADAPARESLDTLQAQVRRCRAILDRLLAGDGGADARTEGFVEAARGWIEEWTHSQPDEPALQIALDPLPGLAARGHPEGWRGALWTLLDNARRASPTGALRVEARREGGCVRLSVEDEGPGLDEAAARHAGEPFFSGWPDGRGTGLGLHVARSFARAVGGDLDLSPRAPRGLTATLVIPLVT